jgi:hypothetical protein
LTVPSTFRRNGSPSNTISLYTTTISKHLLMVSDTISLYTTTIQIYYAQSTQSTHNGTQRLRTVYIMWHDVLLVCRDTTMTTMMIFSVSQLLMDVAKNKQRLASDVIVISPAVHSCFRIYKLREVQQRTNRKLRENEQQPTTNPIIQPT